ncbi:MAG: NAD(P)-dependent oxidoreductase [Spirochaetia bacterium]|jgi:putative NADH-flavin reductase
MKIAVFGITGRIGSRIAQEALSRGHEVTGIARKPGSIPITHAKLRILAGDVTDASGVAKLVAGHDVVINAVGPDMQKGAGSLLTDAAQTLLRTLKRTGVKKLLVVGGAGSLEVAPGLLLMDSPQFPADWKPIAKAHGDALAVYRGEKDLEWVYLSPAALIEPGTRTGSYRVGEEKLLTDEGGNSRISMEDFAVAVLDEIEKPRQVRKRFTVAS